MRLINRPSRACEMRFATAERHAKPAGRSIQKPGRLQPAAGATVARAGG
jgi:hypothetical protein